MRALRTSANEALTEAGPGQHAQVTGLKGLPQAGDELTVGGKELVAKASARLERLYVNAEKCTSHHIT